MALWLETKFKGTVASYWKVTSLFEDFISDKTNVGLGLFIDEETRKEDLGNIVLYKYIEIKGSDLTRPDVYKRLHETEEFKDAKDC